VPRFADQIPWKVRSEALNPNQLAPVSHTVRPSRSTIRLPSVRSQSVPAPPLFEVLLEEDELELLDEELELLLDDELELELELLLELDELDELELLLELDELLDEEEEELLELVVPEDELELEEELEPPLIEPAEAVSVTRSSRAPSSRLLIRSV
jgi:hypothetical protein